MRMLTGLDGVFLHLETPEMPMHVGSLSLLERPPRHRGSFLRDVRRLYERRLPLAPVLARTLREFPLGMANPVWVQAPSVDLDYHLRHVVLPAPGTTAQLERCVGELHSATLDRSRPLWTVDVIEGLAGGQVAIYARIHHAVVDGQAGVELMRILFDATRRGRPPAAARPAPRATERPGVGRVIAGALRHDLEQYGRLVRDLPALARQLAATPAGPRLGPRTPLNVAIGPARGFATASIPFADAHAVAAAHQATVNDVVLAVCAGALRRHLGRHGGVPAEPLVAGMPVSLRTQGPVEFTTQATMTRVSLATHLADPVRRLRAIRDAATAAKTQVSATRSLVPLDFPTIGVPWLLHGLAALYGRPGVANRVPPVVNLVVSNVPGPRQPLYFAGARVLHHWPLSIVGHGLGLNITVESYAGQLEFGVTAASAAVPRAGSIADGLLAAFAQLARRSRTA
jgi:WS/DGAT/MGAT family acyltransferase